MLENKKRTINIGKLTVKEPLGERVYNEIKKAILEGQFAPGDLLQEDFLSDATGASRTPVREALMRLQGDGLVKIIPRKGARISEMDAAELSELVEARGLLETVFFDRAMEKISLEKMQVIKDKMNSIIDEMGSIDPASPPWANKRLEYSKLDFQFHRMLVEAIGNRFFLKYYDSLLDRVILYSHHTVIKFPESFLKSASEHERILTAILKKENQEAKRLIIHHLGKLNKRLTNKVD